MENAPSQGEQGGSNGQSDRKEEEEFVTCYIPLDTSRYNFRANTAENDNLKANGVPDDMQIIGLEEDSIIVRLGSDFYEGRWDDIVGTDAYFDDDGEVLGTSRTRIFLSPIKLVPKTIEEIDAKDEIEKPLWRYVKEIDEERGGSEPNDESHKKELDDTEPS